MSASFELSAAIERVRTRIAEACERVGRHPSEVTLVAVTKTVPIARVAEARDAGIGDFAENYANELAEKASAVDARWHFIGKLQSGTAAKVADAASVLHSAEPGRALERVAGRAERAGRSLDCLVEIDFTGRRQGLLPDPDEVAGFLRTAAEWPSLRVVGLMTIPPPTADPEGARVHFRRLRTLRDALRTNAPELTELSMGMSADYPVAVEEGATMVRVGTALFGQRAVPEVGEGGRDVPPEGPRA
jgi:pyridoxal phosphate enzyme (YggS family)